MEPISDKKNQNIYRIGFRRSDLHIPLEKSKIYFLIKIEKTKKANIALNAKILYTIYYIALTFFAFLAKK